MLESLESLPVPPETAPTSPTSSDVPMSDAESAVDESDVVKDHELSLLNASLEIVGESPLSKWKLDNQNAYPAAKLDQINTTVRKKLKLLAPEKNLEPTTSTAPSNDYDEMMCQLKEKFLKTDNKSEKIKVLTVVPKSWSIRKTAAFFNTSYFMARRAKQLVEEKGIMCDPAPKAGKTLSPETAQLVKEFYMSEEISRIMPGMKDFVSVIEGGVRVHRQKHLVLCNLKEAFNHFKNVHPSIKIGFSKFAELRPKQCVLAGSAGTHSVCVCTIHQNVKLMMVGAKLGKLTENDDIPLVHYNHCLAQLRCNPPRCECFLQQCDECGDTSSLSERLQTTFDNQVIEQIEFKKWTTTDRSTLLTVKLDADEFILEFCRQLEILQRHDFISRQQAACLRDTREVLQPGEFLVVCDFAENYSFVMQDEAQSFHWNNAQATLHPFVCYYREDAESSVSHISYVVISDCNIHDTIAVHLFQKHLINFLTAEFTAVNRLIYFSDGCAGQYKNCKHFLNICYHEQDFGMCAEWNFFATSHGKGPCDGVGGTVKRLAARASLQRAYDNHITTPLQLFEFASTNIPSLKCCFSTTKEYHEEASLLANRMTTAKTIAGTQKLHFFKPLSLNRLPVATYSTAAIKREEFVTAQSDGLNLADVSGYVTAIYDGHWWLASVTNVSTAEEEVHLNFLHPHGPSRSYFFPQRCDTLHVHISDVLTHVEPTTETGRTYKISTEETRKVEEIMQRK